MSPWNYVVSRIASRQRSPISAPPTETFAVSFRFCAWCRLRLPPGLPALPLARWWHRRWHGNTAHLQGGRCARENANSTSNKEGLDQNTDVGLACRHAHEKHEATSSLKRLPRLLLSGARGAPWIAFDGQETNVLLHPIAHKHTVTALRCVACAVAFSNPNNSRNLLKSSFLCLMYVQGTRTASWRPSR